MQKLTQQALKVGNLAQKEWPKNITSDHCKTAYPGRPLIQYVLMLDAGSMGSRIHAYKFNYCNATPELEDEAAFGHVEPGLSSYGNDPEAAAQSLDKLLEISLKAVPLYLHSSTPIAVKATAGLRLLGDEMSNKILEAVRQRLESQYPFPIIKEQGVAVMDGAEEGKTVCPIIWTYDPIPLCFSPMTICCFDTEPFDLSTCRRICMGDSQLSSGEIQLADKEGYSSHLGHGRSFHASRIRTSGRWGTLCRPGCAPIPDELQRQPICPIPTLPPGLWLDDGSQSDQQLLGRQSNQHGHGKYPWPGRDLSPMPPCWTSSVMDHIVRRDSGSRWYV